MKRVNGSGAGCEPRHHGKQYGKARFHPLPPTRHPQDFVDFTMRQGSSPANPGLRPRRRIEPRSRVLEIERVEGAGDARDVDEGVARRDRGAIVVHDQEVTGEITGRHRDVVDLRRRGRRGGSWSGRLDGRGKGREVRGVPRHADRNRGHVGCSSPR